MVLSPVVIYQTTAISRLFCAAANFASCAELCVLQDVFLPESPQLLQLRDGGSVCVHVDGLVVVQNLF